MVVEPFVSSKKEKCFEQIIYGGVVELLINRITLESVNKRYNYVVKTSPPKIAVVSSIIYNLIEGGTIREIFWQRFHNKSGTQVAQQSFRPFISNKLPHWTPWLIVY